MKKVVPVVSYCSCCLINSLFLFLVVEFLDGLLEFVLHLIHSLLETLHALAQATHQFGNLLATKQEQHHEYDSDNLSRPKIEESQYSIQFHIILSSNGYSSCKCTTFFPVIVEKDKISQKIVPCYKFVVLLGIETINFFI